jgi:hypothetical protein
VTGAVMVVPTVLSSGLTDTSTRSPLRSSWCVLAPPP